MLRKRNILEKSELKWLDVFFSISCRTPTTAGYSDVSELWGSSLVTSSFCSSFIFSCAGSSLLLAGFVWLPQAGPPLVGVPGLVAAVAPPVQSAGSPSRAQYWRLRLALVAQCHVGPSWTREDWQADASLLDHQGSPGHLFCYSTNPVCMVS